MKVLGQRAWKKVVAKTCSKAAFGYQPEGDVLTHYTMYQDILYDDRVSSPSCPMEQQVVAERLAFLQVVNDRAGHDGEDTAQRRWNQQQPMMNTAAEYARLLRGESRL